MLYENKHATIYVPEDMPSPVEIDHILTGVELVAANALSVTRLLAAGSGAFAIVVFNSTMTMLNVKAFERGIPSDIRGGVWRLSLFLAASFFLSCLAYFSATNLSEVVATIRRAVAQQDRDTYRLCRIRYV